MASGDNPARRMHGLLRAYHEVSTPGFTIAVAWGKALDVTEKEVPRRLSLMARLVADVDEAMHASRVESVADMVEYHSDAWAAPIMHPNHTLNEPSTRVTDHAALATLRMVADLLDTGAGPLVRTPTDAETASLSDEIDAALKAVLADDELPTEIRTLINHRLSDMSWAIRHLDLMGGEGLQEAAERLAARLPTHIDAGLLDKLKNLTRRVVTITTPVATVAKVVLLGYELSPVVMKAIES